jgi:HPt (histidine-containing phosphotransfer) domain-containing protein
MARSDTPTSKLPVESDFVDVRLNKAENAIRALSDQFCSSVQDDFRAIREAIAAAEAKPGDNDSQVALIFATAHNIKGQGATFGFELLTKVAQKLCVVAHKLDHADEAALSVLRHHAKAMEVIIENDIKGMAGNRGKVLLEKLELLTQTSL